MFQDCDTRSMVVVPANECERRIDVNKSLTMDKNLTTKRGVPLRAWSVACLAVIFLMAASPAISQEADLDDEGMILFVADVSSQDPPQGMSEMKGQVAPRNAPGQASADSRSWQRPGYGRWGGIAAYLDLSNDQITRMRDLHNRYYQETRNLRYDLMQRRLEMRRLFLDPKADSAALLAKQREVSSARQRLGDAMARMMVDWRAILTPQQIQKLDMAALGHSRMGTDGMMMGGGWGYGMGGEMQHGMMMGRGMMGDGR